MDAPGSLGSHAKDFLHALWPILFTGVLYVLWHVPPALGVLLAIFGLLLLHRVDVRRWGGIFKAAREPDMVLLLFGALWFKLNLEASGAVGDVVAFFHQMHMPPLLVLFVLPFLVSFSTGVTTPTVAITYPFLPALHPHAGRHVAGRRDPGLCGRGVRTGDQSDSLVPGAVRELFQDALAPDRAEGVAAGAVRRRGGIRRRSPESLTQAVDSHVFKT